MSTHDGKFKESVLQKFCLDYFKDPDPDYTHYFLSHYHSDHMRGINDRPFTEYFSKSPGVFIYCSEITKTLLAKNSNIDSNKLKAIDQEGLSIQVSDDVIVQVTTLHAGHCPGSIMFLFEWNEGRVLCTGDFRLSMEDVKSMSPLHDASNNVLPIDNVYLDTSFALPSFTFFPTREQSLEIICREVTKWLASGDNFKVAFERTGNISTEYLIVEVAKYFKTPVHVAANSREKYLSCIPGLEKYITDDINSTNFHFCSVCCYDCFEERDRVMFVRPCCFSFDLIDRDKPETWYDWMTFVTAKPNQLKVAYSSHPSLEELAEFIRYLKPKDITCCVTVINRVTYTNDQLVKTINGFFNKEEASPKKSTSSKRKSEDQLRLSPLKPNSFILSPKRKKKSRRTLYLQHNLGSP